jgi:agarase
MVPAAVPPHPLSLFKPETLRGAAGFFRVGQTPAGQWWLIDPHDQPFFSRGVAGVNRTGRTGAGAVEAYAATLPRKYDATDPRAWADATVLRLWHWHLNTLGPWTGPELDDCGLARVELADFRRAAPSTAIRFAGANVPDVFDPQWVAGCARIAAEVCEPWHGRRELIGYFTDDALGWAPLRADRPSLLQICLSVGPAFPAWHAAWEFALAAHEGSLDRLAAAWETPLPSKEALRQLTLADVALATDGYRRDHERFTREFARRYFSTCAAAIRAHDPDHLVLGCRSDGPLPAAVLAEAVAPAVDLLSAGALSVEATGEVDHAHAVTGSPVLATGWSWSADLAHVVEPSPDEAPGLTRVERMLARGRESFARLAVHPGVVGWSWPQWVDGPDDAAPFGRGLVRVDDREAAEHIDLLADLNARAESLRRAAVAGPEAS